MENGEKYYRSKYPKVKELSLMDKEIISLLNDYNIENEKELLVDFFMFFRVNGEKLLENSIEELVNVFFKNRNKVE